VRGFPHAPTKGAGHESETSPPGSARELGIRLIFPYPPDSRHDLCLIRGVDGARAVLLRA